MSTAMRVLSHVKFSNNATVSIPVVTSLPTLTTNDVGAICLNLSDGMLYILTQVGNSVFWFPQTYRKATYKHVQTISADVWTVTHNLNTSDFLIFVFDNNNLPIECKHTVVNPNSLTVQFLEKEVGNVYVITMDQQILSNLKAIELNSQKFICGDLVIQNNDITNTATNKSVFGSISDLETNINSLTTGLNDLSTRLNQI